MAHTVAQFSEAQAHDKTTQRRIVIEFRSSLWKDSGNRKTQRKPLEHTTRKYQQATLLMYDGDHPLCLCWYAQGEKTNKKSFNKKTPPDDKLTFGQCQMPCTETPTIDSILSEAEGSHGSMELPSPLPVSFCKTNLVLYT